MQGHTHSAETSHKTAEVLHRMVLEGVRAVVTTKQLRDWILRVRFNAIEITHSGQLYAVVFE